MCLYFCLWPALKKQIFLKIPCARLPKNRIFGWMLMAEFQCKCPSFPTRMHLGVEWEWQISCCTHSWIPFSLSHLEKKGAVIFQEKWKIARLFLFPWQITLRVYYKEHKLAGLSQNMIILISKLHRWTKTAKEKAEMLIQVKMSKFGVFQNSGFL